jgi:hypothetical protein
LNFLDSKKTHYSSALHFLEAKKVGCSSVLHFLDRKKAYNSSVLKFLENELWIVSQKFLPTLLALIKPISHAFLAWIKARAGTSLKEERMLVLQKVRTARELSLH